MKHNHSCNCGDLYGVHFTGIKGCRRKMIDAPELIGTNLWLVNGFEISQEVMRELGYIKHACGCWSCKREDKP